MALLKLGAVVSDIRGSVGGSTFARTSAGLVLKNKCSPVNKNTNRQSLVKNFISTLQQNWLALSQDQRDCWKLWTSFNPVLQNNISGNFINAQQTFIRLNLYRQLYGFAIIEDPVFNKAAILPVTASVGLAAGLLVLTTSRVMVPAEEFIVLFLTTSLSLTINNPGSLFRSMIFTTTASSTFDVTTAYTNVFGTGPTGGSKIFMKFTTLDAVSGILFPFQIQSFVL